MKKAIQILVVFALMVSAIAIARANPAWASSLFTGGQASGQGSLYPKSIVVTGSGLFNIGGVCTIDIKYKGQNLKDNVDSEVPIKESQKVPFNYSPDQLYYPGCHVVHFKADKEVKQVTSDDGTWKVCFGVRPEVQTKIYYYEDKPDNGQKVWIPLPTTVENSYACTDAIYTGVYMPAGYIQPTPGAGAAAGATQVVPPGPGSVVPPPPSNIITKSGTYSIGGICGIIVVYKLPNLYDDVWVDPLAQDTQTIPFPSDKDTLYYPGCHVLHYSPLMKQTTDAQGSWTICFAARPDKKMTIYYYTDDLTSPIPPWTPLPTTTDNGQACAPANYTGLYVPAGQ